MRAATYFRNRQIHYILVTEWQELKKPKLEDFTKNMRKPILINGRRINPKQFSEKLNFTAIGLGK